MKHKKYTCLQLTNTCIRGVVLQLHKGAVKITASGEKPLSVTLERMDAYHHPALAQTVGDLFLELSGPKKKGTVIDSRRWGASQTC